MTLGFIGTGALTSAIVTGLKSRPANPDPILLSPRNGEVAKALAARFPDVRIASSNQAVLDSCHTVFLALRPPIALEVLPQLLFRADHQVISLVATLSRGAVTRLVQPAEKVTKAIPIPPVATREGVTLIHPPDPATSRLFATLGEVFEIAEEGKLAALTTATAIFAAYFTYLDTTHEWLSTHGVPGATGRAYVAALFRALAKAPDHAPHLAFRELAGEYATRGGINEQVLELLTARGVFDSLREGLDAIHRRITGTT
jgi:pyrroline-5-carboxylate reductase